MKKELKKGLAGRMDIVWRIENNEGEGCYRDEKTKEVIDWSDDFNPLPINDEGIDRETQKKEICGFISLEQVEKWFSEAELKGLKKLGFKLKEVEVKKITAFGKRQVLAVR